MSKLLPPSLDDFEALAAAALDSLPPQFARFVKGVVMRVEEFPDQETEQEMELESPFDILGLYKGSSLAGQEGRGPFRSAPVAIREGLRSDDRGPAPSSQAPGEVTFRMCLAPWAPRAPGYTRRATGQTPVQVRPA